MGNEHTVDLGMTAMKEAGAKWLEEMFKYISGNLQIIVIGFVRAGITGALDKSTDSELLPGPVAKTLDTDDDDSDEEDILLLITLCFKLL